MFRLIKGQNQMVVVVNLNRAVKTAAREYKMKSLFLFVISMLLSACSGLPPKIENAPWEDVDYRQAHENSERFAGLPIRWGGTIVDVTNEEEYSEMQVLYYPLNAFGRPSLRQPNGGRFLMQSDKFLDPAIYVNGTEITVAGTFSGEIDRKVGNKTIQLPLISSAESHLWPVYKDRPFPNYSGFGSYTYYGYVPYYRPYRRSRYYNRCY